MPELPEVQTTVDGLSNYILGRKVEMVKFHRDKIRYQLDRNWIAQIESQQITKIYRRAKLIIMELETDYLLWHLGMTASMRVCEDNEEKRLHDHIEFVFAKEPNDISDKIITNKKNETTKNTMRFHDPRRFGSMKLFNKLEDLYTTISHYGPEPLSADFSLDYLYKLSRTKTTPIKNFIMNQETVVGVGNIYACEALFTIGIRPINPANKVKKSHYEELVKAIKQVLEKAISQGGTTLKDFENADAQPGYFQQTLAVYGRAGKECNVCQAIIEAIKIGGRNSFYCPNCQK